MSGTKISTMTRLLFIEDNEDLAFAVSETLAILGDYEITQAFNGKDGLEAYHKIKPHIVVSDVEMPLMNGFDVARTIRRIDKQCIIFLATALSTTQDILTGFEIGIDEYVKKPYSAPELHARIQAILKRLGTPSLTNSNESITFIGNYQFDSESKYLYLDTEKIKLTPKEFSILEILVENKNKVVSREKLTQDLWGESDFFSSRSLDVFIAKLRKYLSKDKKVQIVTIRGEGIKLEVE